LIDFLYRYKYYLLAGLGSWLLFVAQQLSIAYRMQANPEMVLIHEGFGDMILFMFFLTNILLVRRVVHDGKDRNPEHLLRIVLYTGAIGIGAVFFSRWYLSPYQNTEQELITLPVLHAITLLALHIFVFTGIYTFKKFIFYTGSRVRTGLWTIFEVFLGAGLLIVFENPFYFISEWIKVGLLIISLGIIAYFSVFTRWVAYLTLKQKLNSIFLLGMTVVILFLLMYEEGVFTYDLSSLIHEYFFYRYFLMGVAALFIASYSLFSILVLIFNLPTGFVFEKTRKDLVSIQKIQQSILPGLAQEGAARTLLEAAILSSNSSAGWIEMEGEKDSFICHGIQENDTHPLKQDVNLRKLVLDKREIWQNQDLTKNQPFSFKKRKYRSLIVLPIQTRFANIGALFLVQDIPFGFSEDNIFVLKSFADQAALALENISLTEKSLEIERYREQLAIARQMQQKLYPTQFPDSPYIRVFARNQQAESVGGDYYDILRTGEGIYKIIIGDVSGKGTTAAFYMAQVKGMFQSLARTKADPVRFITLINQAISTCMDKGSFITLTYIELDLTIGKAWIARAGHCPTLFYSGQEKKSLWLIEGGLALGVVREEGFSQHIKTQEISVQPGDRLMLFTDGIVEARDEKGEEFDYERFMSAAQNGIRLSPEDLSQSIIQEVQDFSGGVIEDDYTLMIIDITGNPEKLNFV
jgi:phosphoserine phosphatase RsbU/P